MAKVAAKMVTWAVAIDLAAPVADRGRVCAEAHACGLSWIGLARLCGVQERTVRRWVEDYEASLECPEKRMSVFPVVTSDRPAISFLRHLASAARPGGGNPDRKG